MTWTPNREALDQANRTSILFKNCSRWVPPAFQQRSMNSRGGFVWPPGLRVVRDYIRSQYNVQTFYGRGRSRVMLPGQRRDAHQEARAIDAMCNVETGHKIADWFLANAAGLGCILIINDGTQWGPGINQGNPKVYRGSSPHTDHVHAELSVEGLLGMTSWFAGKLSNEDVAEYQRTTEGDPLITGDVSFQGVAIERVLPIVPIIAGIATAGGIYLGVKHYG